KAFRAGFPMVEKRPYLATAGGAPISRRAAEAGRRYYDETLHQGDAPFGEWLDRVDEVRAQVGRLIGARAGQVAFVAHASAAMNIAALYLTPRAHVVSVRGEFPSVTQPFLARGHEVAFVEPSIEAIAAAIRPDTAAIAVSHVQYQTGERLDLSLLGRIARDADVLCFVDATQSMGAVPVDFAAGPDLLTASCYKWLCAGYGCGVVALSDRLLERASPVFGWRSAVEPYALDETSADPAATAVRLEMGHPPFAPVLCLGGALGHLEETIGFDGVWPRIADLQTLVRSEAERLGMPPPSTPEGHSGIAVFPVSDPASVKASLARAGIAVSARAGSIRMSTHAFVSEDDVSRAMEAFAAL
ncbi:MAG: aminotransferase class V-fold PLP-dependent enzyme, partial [Rubricella sp.]